METKWGVQPAGTTIRARGITGKKLVVIIRSYVSFNDEECFIDNVSVTKSTPAPVALPPTPAPVSPPTPAPVSPPTPAPVSRPAIDAALANARNDIQGIITDRLAAQFLRLAFHDCIGGCDGTLCVEIVLIVVDVMMKLNEAHILTLRCNDSLFRSSLLQAASTQPIRTTLDWTFPFKRWRRLWPNTRPSCPAPTCGCWRP